MNIRALAKTTIAKAASKILSLTDESGWPISSGRSATTGKIVTELTALKISSSFSAIKLISETIGILPLKLYRKTADGRQRISDHAVARLLTEEPNPWMTPQDLKEAIAVSLCCWGQAYNRIDRLGDRPLAIVPVSKLSVQAEIRDGAPRYRLSDSGGKNHAIDYRDICPIKGFGGTAQLEGFAPYQLHRETLGLTSAVEEYGARFFGNGGRPSGVLVYPKWLTKEQREAVKEKYREEYGNLEKANGLAVFEGGTEYKEVRTQNNEAQFLETKKHQIAEIARIWRVPLHMLMDADRATHNNSEQENLHFLTYTLQSYLIRIEHAFNRFLLTREERDAGYYIEFDRNALLRGDSAGRAEYYRTMRMIGVMSINEIRGRENLDRREGGDDLLVPLNMLPNDMIRQFYEQK